mmetsp:Transcript_71917/g.194549  ORF Transcript_71917/g.194549 Transcript_71917/m.194549 type:complete len:297 (-) Transcript_71917:14-904(-)
MAPAAPGTQIVVVSTRADAWRTAPAADAVDADEACRESCRPSAGAQQSIVAPTTAAPGGSWRSAPWTTGAPTSVGTSACSCTPASTAKPGRSAVVATGNGPAAPPPPKTSVGAATHPWPAGQPGPAPASAHTATGGCHAATVWVEQPSAGSAPHGAAGRVRVEQPSQSGGSPSTTSGMARVVAGMASTAGRSAGRATDTVARAQWAGGLLSAGALDILPGWGLGSAPPGSAGQAPVSQPDGALAGGWLVRTLLVGRLAIARAVAPSHCTGSRAAATIGHGGSHRQSARGTRAPAED